MALFPLGPVIVEYVLRILLTIDEEVVARYIFRSDEEHLQSTLIKDAMRDRAVPKLVDALYVILFNYHKSVPELAVMCLRVIGVYASTCKLLQSPSFSRRPFARLLCRLIPLRSHPANLSLFATRVLF